MTASGWASRSVTWSAAIANQRLVLTRCALPSSALKKPHGYSFGSSSSRLGIQPTGCQTEWYLRSSPSTQGPGAPYHDKAYPWTFRFAPASAPTFRVKWNGARLPASFRKGRDQRKRKCVKKRKTGSMLMLHCMPKATAAVSCRCGTRKCLTLGFSTSSSVEILARERKSCRKLESSK